MYGAGHSDELAGAVVLGSSFGGLDALKTVVPALPASFPLPVVVVHHRRPEAANVLSAILRSRSAMPVDDMEPGYRLRAGRIAVAPPGGVSRISPSGVVTVDRPGREDGVSHAVDRALNAIATRFADRAIAVIMTGRLSDGSVGVRAVKRAGGFVVVQDPAAAAAAGMPVAALATGCVDHRVPLGLVAATLVAVTMAPGGLELLRVPAPPWAAAPAAV